MVGCLPYMSVVTLISLYLAIYYLIYQTQQHFTIEILKTLLAFSTQQIRNSFLFIIFERIYATVKLEKYTMHSKLQLFWALNALSLTASLLYTGTNLYGSPN